MGFEIGFEDVWGACSVEKAEVLWKPDQAPGVWPLPTSVASPRLPSNCPSSAVPAWGPHWFLQPAMLPPPTEHGPKPIPLPRMLWVKVSFHDFAVQSPFSSGLPPGNPSTKHAFIAHTPFFRSISYSCNCMSLGFFNGYINSNHVISYKFHKGGNTPFKRQSFHL